MKTWTEIYTKYKDTEWMKEFMWSYQGDEEAIIQDIWGYLICFAEMKGYTIWLSQCIINFVNEKGYNKLHIKDAEMARKSTEERMLWCADKFFEVTNEI